LLVFSKHWKKRRQKLQALESGSLLRGEALNVAADGSNVWKNG